MRWNALFADLDQRFAAMSDADEDAELPDQVRVVYGATTVQQRFAGAEGADVTVDLCTGARLSGELARVGADWLLLRPVGPAEVVVALSAVVGADGLTARTGAPLSALQGRLDLRRALRALARDRSPVQLHDTAGRYTAGTVDRVGADHVELAVHPLDELRRAGQVRSVRLVPVAAIAAVRSMPHG